MSRSKAPILDRRSPAKAKADDSNAGEASETPRWRLANPAEVEAVEEEEKVEEAGYSAAVSDDRFERWPSLQRLPALTATS